MEVTGGMRSGVNTLIKVDRTQEVSSFHATVT